MNDYDDIAKQAVLSASSEAGLKTPENEAAIGIEQGFSFEHSLFQLFPVSGNQIDFIETLIFSDRQVCLKASIFKAEDIWDFSSIKKPDEQIAASSVETTGSGQQWVRFPFKINNICPGLFLIKIEAVNNPGKAMWLGSLNGPVGVVRGRVEAPPCARGNLAPDYQTMRGTFIFRIYPESKPYSAQNIINGVARPERWTNLWVSDMLSGNPEWVELAWNREVLIKQVNISFDGQFDSNVTWPPPLGVFGCRVLPAIVKRYSISVSNKGKWTTIQKIENNYQYNCCHTFTPIKADRLKITIYETNGAAEARIFEVRVYS